MLESLPKGTIRIKETERTYRYYVPSTVTPETPAPLMISYHGAGSDAAYHSRLTGFAELAEEEGFIVLFPEALEVTLGQPLSRQWNEDRKGSLAEEADIEDIRFTEELLKKWKGYYTIDTEQIYATGFSNGASFSLRAAIELPGTFAGVGAVAGPLAEPLQRKETNGLPPLVFIMGGEDPVVPFSAEDANGEISYDITGLLGARATVEWWTYQSASSWERKEERFAPRSLHDPTRVERHLYETDTGKTAAALYIIKGGGHTWPGGPKVQHPEFGRVSQQLEGAREIWRMFQLGP
ncbi:alpha/beta hydrolase family esterase [Salibacterium aidingense]|uniref:alpha/beta hydrolase family esterase n=1 Tax=Salibacterium aidingense TaxID=384933 RepID=UPI0004259C00|nr:PHB depolymerase family esterase [Salibacterium aidingense]